MGKIRVLDVTLRDGGCVNNFNFGQIYMEKILRSVEQSNIEIIELGYIDEKEGDRKERTKFIDEKVITNLLLKEKKNGINYVAMIDYGKFSSGKLQARTKNGIDGIRLAFHKKDVNGAIEEGKRIIEKGYDLYIQPMLCMRYSDKELLELILRVNEELPQAIAFYLVDSFGEMRNNDVIRLMNLADHNLKSDIMLGFHAHNNLQLAYSNAMRFVDYVTDREIIVDSSVMGMGKGAGNLNTELLLEHLNLFYGKKYCISPLLQLIDQVIYVIHNEFYWGYSAEYYLSSIKQCSPSYAKYFYKKHNISIESLSELLEMIQEEKKVSFDEKYAEELYIQYNSQCTVNDQENIDKIKSYIGDKKALVIAPGKSINYEKDKIKKLLSEEDIVSFSLNNFAFHTNFYLITRTELVQKALEQQVGISIIPSNLIQSNNDNVYIINYKRWTVKEEQIYDSSGIMAIRLFEEMGIKNIMLAGFDGFSSSVNQNYYIQELRRPINDEQVNLYNNVYHKMFCELEKYAKLTFITPSQYEH